MMVEVLMMMHSWVSLQEYVALTKTQRNHLHPRLVRPYRHPTGCNGGSLLVLVGVLLPFRASPSLRERQVLIRGFP